MSSRFSQPPKESDSYDDRQFERPREPLSLVKDPLSDVTRKERRTLLGASAIGVAMVKANLLPQKISTLGIDFQQLNQAVLLKSVALVILYFLVAFLLYATSDLLTWRIAYQKVIQELVSAKDQTTQGTSDYMNRPSFEQRFIDSSVGPVSVLRAIFEFVVPALIAVYAVAVLLGHS